MQFCKVSQFLKSPVREIRTPGSVGVRAANWAARLPGVRGSDSPIYLTLTKTGTIFVAISMRLIRSLEDDFIVGYL